MIPYQILLFNFIWNKEKSLKVRALEPLGNSGFLFRVVSKWEKEFQEAHPLLECSFFHYEKREYHQVFVRDYRMERDYERERELNDGGIPNGQDAIYFRLITGEKAFRTEMEALLYRYTDYIVMKQELSEQELAVAMTSYPSEERYASQIREWRESRMEEAFSDSPIIGMEVPEGVELAICLDRPALYEKYLSVPWDAFFSWFREENGMNRIRLSTDHVSHLYIGSQYCPLLFPDLDILVPLLNKAALEGIIPVLCFAPMAERNVEKTRRLLLFISRFLSEKRLPLEFIINDVGMARLKMELEVTPQGKNLAGVSCTAGILLNKRPKDSRRVLLPNRKACCSMNLSMEASGYGEYLKKNCGFSGFSYESVACPETYPSGHHCLHFPLFQMNTASYCTLFAASIHGSRGYQRAVEHCPFFCNDTAFYYPEGTGMIGLGNSLFGFDSRALSEPAWLEKQISAGISRLVVSL